MINLCRWKKAVKKEKVHIYNICIIAEILTNAKQLSEDQYGYGLFSFSCAYVMREVFFFFLYYNMVFKLANEIENAGYTGK